MLTERVDWTLVVDRLVTEGRISLDTPVELYLSAAGDLHGRADCAGSSRPASPVSVPLGVASATSSRNCDCGGWLASSIGARVAAAHACFSAEAERDSGRVPSSWTEVFSLLTAHRGFFIAALSSGDPDRVEFSSRAVDASLCVAERSRGVLDPVVLHRAIASQGLRVPLIAGQAPGFTNWARSLRLERLGSYEGFREVVPFLEGELHASLAPREPVLVGLHIRDPWAAQYGVMPFPWGLPAELALLLWLHRRLGRPRVALHLHPGVGEGLLVIANPSAPSQWSVSVASGLEPDPATADLAVLLWSESPDTYPDLDSALQAARALASG